MPEHELSVIPREARPFQGQHAGVVSRILAATVDTLLVAVTLLVAYLAVAGLRLVLDPREARLPDPRLVVVLAIGGIVYCCYLTACWAWNGRTCGDLLMGLRVVMAAGGPVGWLRAAARAVAYLGLPLGLLWVAVDPAGRSLQDLVLRTVVIYDWRPHAGAHPITAPAALEPSGPERHP